MATKRQRRRKDDERRNGDETTKGRRKDDERRKETTNSEKEKADISLIATEVGNIRVRWKRRVDECDFQKEGKDKCTFINKY